MAVYCRPKRLPGAAGHRRKAAGRQVRRRRGRGSGASWVRGDLFLRAEMDNHLWAEALRGGLAPQPFSRAVQVGPGAIRAEVSEDVLRGGSRCLQLGGCLRLVSGPLAGCLGILLPEPGHCLCLRIVRHPLAWGEPEYVESVH